MADYNSSLPVRTEANGDVAIKLVDGTVTSQAASVNASGEVAVTATNLDIRDLTSASDSVEVLQNTHDDLNANANIQVGNADVANGNPVPVSDAGGSLTVDATDLDIRDLSSATDSVSIADGGNSITVDATDLDIRDLTSASDSVEVLQNTHDDLNANANIQVGNTDVSASNPVPVSLSASVAGDEINSHSTAAAIAGGATSNHDYTVTAAKTLILTQIEASGSGKMKIQVQVEGPALTFTTKFVLFNSTANPNMQLKLESPLEIAAGLKVRVIRTNRDNQAQDVYSTISGQEV